jgi:uncharacterized protein (TIGR03085 family)
MQSISAAERAALCTLLDDLGPDAPTLCEGWTTSDLAAHLYVRERRPDAAPGVIISPLAGYTAKTMRSVLAHHGYAGIVERVRKGPPLPVRLIDRQVNTLEYFIHHEDVRRAAEEWAPREDRDLDGAIWSALRKGARLLTRRVKGAGLDLVQPDGSTIAARAGEPKAAISGGPQEIALYLYGRAGVARVTVEADDAARAALEGASFSV